MSADAQFKQLVDRILRCREDEDAAKDATKEVYAELKGLGYDKTAAGALVSELRKREKNPDQFAERETVLDLYRDAYQRGNVELPSHAHTRGAATPQPARVASIAEQRSAFREGAPISQDFTYENASVYFIAFHGISRVKIGLSNDVERRIADLEKACGDVAEVLAVIPGNRKAETAALRHHAEWCISGEWFDLCDDLIASIKAYAADEPVATHTHENSKHKSEGPKSRPGDAAASLTQQSNSPRQERQSAEERSSDRSGGQFGDAPKPAHIPEMDRADDGSFETGIVAAGNRLEANPAGPVAGEVSHAGAGESPATIPEPFEPPAFLQKDRAPLRPHCLHQDNLELCAGSGSKHCHSCLKARDEALVAA